MKSKFQVARTLRQISSLAIATAAILQTAAMFTEFEPNTNYFYSGAILPTFAWACAIIGALLGSASALILPKKALQGDIFRSHSVFYPSAIGCLLAGLLLLTSARGSLGTTSAVLLLLAAAYTVLSGNPQMREDHKTAVVLWGFVAIAACIALNAYYYFDFSIEMNSPVKVTVQLAILLIMLIFTGELRFVLGTQMPRMHLILQAWTTAIGALSALSLPIAYLLGVEVRADYVAGAILILTAVLTQYLQSHQLIRSSCIVCEHEEQTRREENLSNDFDFPYAPPEDLQNKNSEDEQ